MCKSCARTTGNVRSVFFALMDTAMNTANTQRAQSQKISAQQHYQQATPCVCGTSICAVLPWLVDFFEACFISAIDDLSLIAAVDGIAILDEHIRAVWIQDFCITGPYIIA